MHVDNFCIIVSGPTGVGKTDFVDVLAQSLPSEIVNGDMGQLYTPLTIGTAKPDWQNQSVVHHLFDVIDEPELFTVISFRARVKKACMEIWGRGNIPIIVGGSGYYLTALFFPPAEHEVKIKAGQYGDHDLWQKLNEIDSVRAEQIDPNDAYRIKRALDIWYSTGIKPSEYEPKYDPIAHYFFAWLSRDRQDLYSRINLRTQQMIDEGWPQEVEALTDKWRAFLKQKKIIGYPEVIDYVDEKISKQAMISIIQKKTRNYAKRQMTFWRMLKKKLEHVLNPEDSAGMLHEFNLSNESAKTLSAHLSDQVKRWIKGRK